MTNDDNIMGLLWGFTFFLPQVLRGDANPDSDPEVPTHRKGRLTHEGRARGKDMSSILNKISYAVHQLYLGGSSMNDGKDTSWMNSGKCAEVLLISCSFSFYF